MLPASLVTLPLMLLLLVVVISPLLRRLIFLAALPTVVAVRLMLPVATTVMLVALETVNTSPLRVLMLPLQVKTVLPELRDQLPEQMEGVPLTAVPPEVLKV